MKALVLSVHKLDVTDSGMPLNITIAAADLSTGKVLDYLSSGIKPFEAERYNLTIGTEALLHFAALPEELKAIYEPRTDYIQLLEVVIFKLHNFRDKFKDVRTLFVLNPNDHTAVEVYGRRTNKDNPFNGMDVYDANTLISLYAIDTPELSAKDKANYGSSSVSVHRVVKAINDLTHWHKNLKTKTAPAAKVPRFVVDPEDDEL